MARKDWYTVKTGTDTGWEVKKFDEDFRLSDTYYVDKNPNPTERMCTCFAGTKDTCRHRQIVTLFLTNGIIDSNKLYNFDKAKWYIPPQIHSS